MTFTVTAPAQPNVQGNEKHEIHQLTAGLGTELVTPTISAKFLRRISRAILHGMDVLEDTVDNSVQPPTAIFNIRGPLAVSPGGNVTIATAAGNNDVYLIVERDGTLVGVDFSGVDVLAVSDTNFITWTITNLGQAGAGSTAMLAATDANTTKSTGGTALAANAKRQLTLHGTPANLAVVAGDRLRIRAAVTGTLANTVTGPAYTLRFKGPIEGYVELIGD